MITQKGKEPNLEKVKAILDMQLPTSIVDVQRLTISLAALSELLLKSTD